jgi:DNA invertase Pin-like site-specific DNA recombinase
MRHAAIYGRYSTDSQQPTSINDQVSRCRSLASYEGLTVEDDWVFADQAVSGKAEGSHKRKAYQRLLDAWDANMLDVVYADEVSRFSRDLVEGGLLMRRIEQTGVRVLTGDGIDTRREGWQSLWSLRLTIAAEELRGVSRRTSRTMKGTLERGLMIAAPPYGYRLRVERLDAEGKKLQGALWLIDAAEAAVVVDIFTWLSAPTEI